VSEAGAVGLDSIVDLHPPADVAGHGREHVARVVFVASPPHELLYGRHDRVLRCPWHGWESDLESGRSLLDPRRSGLKTYEVTVEDGVVVLHT
jgi:hypothetical protein